ncbi:MAG: DUF1566 domain-containing protein [Gammaproteobacteria bacterium]|nr:DUF1566 domain-containing protein [Gammaproteobacteria bacterium]
MKLSHIRCIIISLLILPGTGFAGDLNSPTGPTAAESAMVRLEDICNRLESGTAGSKRTGAFTEPAVGPGATGCTLNEAMDKAPEVDAAGALPAEVANGKKFWGLTSGGNWGLQTGSGTLATGTAAAAEVLSGKTFSNASGAGTGTMTNAGAQNITPGISDQLISQGYHNGSGQVAGDADLVAGNIKTGVTLFGVTGSVTEATGTAAASDVLSGQTFSHASGAGTGTMTNAGAQNIMPGTAAQPITQGYHNGSGQVAGDVDLVPGNIKSGVPIFGVSGSYGGTCTYNSGREKSGQTTSYQSGDDGTWQKGAALPSPRFTDNDDGSITDNLTGLIWLKDANCFGQKDWVAALTDANDLASGSCGLTDGTSAGNWRLPNIKEIRSLLDFGQSDPALPSGHPFSSVQTALYWTSTTNAANTINAWNQGLGRGRGFSDSKASTNYVLPVRGGQ